MIQKSLESIHAQTQEYEVENRPGNRWGQRIFRNMITTWFAAGILKETQDVTTKKKSDVIQCSCPKAKTLLKHTVSSRRRDCRV